MLKKLAGLTAVAGLLVAGTASAEIAGSSHDLSGDLGTALTDICTICHAPHANESAGSDGLLWNHTPSPNAGSYTPYVSDTLDGGGSGTPGPVSTLCLSCHDGAVAVDSFGGVTRSANITSFANGGPAFGTAMADDHPVGIVYDPVADTELALTSTGINFNNGVPAGTETIASLLFGTNGDTIECGSCHDVHNTDSSAGSAGDGLLRVANDATSSLCTTCHLK
jgi:hypothetical protein